MAEEQKPVEVKETAPVTTTDAPEAKKEVVPVEEGTLEHKGLNFPKNFIYSKEFFWFGSDAVESKNLSSYLKTEKSAETAHRNAAWASHTGKGLLFFGDKTAPQGVINLADAAEPAADGANKFHFTAKGHKHVFKAANAEERDNWISQLKIKITEAKELASTVTETEAYKTALESFKPAKKEEKKEEKAAEKEEPKRRSASRKRASIFGSLLSKKEESKKEEKKEEETATTETPAAEAAAPVEAAAATETPAVETPATPAAETPAATEAAVEDKPAETPKEEKKPAPPTKRNSIFGATTPLAVDVSNPSTVPVETKETTPATNGETRPELKAEKRKSSLPFGFGKRDKSPAAKSPAHSDNEEGEKTEKTSAFSKLRATIKGRGKTADKPADKLEKTEEKPEEPAAEAAKTEETPAAETSKATDEPENKPENVASSTPAPVTAAA
uniref:Immunogenic protein n=1 Tax=Colletotrichum fructicola (strain Nara gc5) TaxID=1213859 RepID=L2G0Y0_COLFN